MVAPVVVLKLAKRINDIVAFAERAAYSWEYAEGEADWSPLPDTMQASTTVDTLTPGRGYRFRARAHTSAGMGDFRDPVELLAP